MDNTNYITIFVSLMGALKLTAEVFGLHFISNDQINALANLAAVILTIVGICMSHKKKGDVVESK